MKKLFLMLPIVALIAAACNSTPRETYTPAPIKPTAQTYTNGTYNFRFEYPSYMEFVDVTYANLSDKIVQLQIKQNQYPGTNFGDAAFTVSATSAKDLADCLKQSPPPNGDGFKTKVAINGTNFYMTNSSGAAAGNLYESKIYRALRGNRGACLELSETIHTSNIGNYPTGTVTEVNKNDVQSKLDAVLNSFEFTD